MNKKFQRFGAMLEGKERDNDGNKTYYIKLEDDFAELLGNKFIRVERPDAALNAMLRNESIDESEYEERVAKIPDFVKFNMTLVTEK